MKATEIVQTLPEQNTPEREEQIIKYVADGYYIDPRMVDITSEYNGHTATIRVMSDALMLGEPDDFLRINATMEGEQRIANILDLSLITPKIADLIRLQADVVIQPCTQTADAYMAYTSRMVEHSKDVTDNIKKVVESKNDSFELWKIAKGLVGLVSTVGKDWVLTNKLTSPTLAANYGWHTKDKPDPDHPEWGPYWNSHTNEYMWQTLGTAHNTKHVDYSQVIRLMAKDIIVDGSRMTVEEVATDLELSGLISYECPLQVLYHPPT